MEKKSDPVYVRLTQDHRDKVRDLSKKLGGKRDISESEIIDWLLGLGLDIYEFNQSHFSVFPIGLNFRSNGNEKEE